jgi:flagellar basal body-associated protein FliL
MKKLDSKLIGKVAIVLFVAALVLYIVFFFSDFTHEGDPYLAFIEVPFNDTTNNTIIHINEKDIFNIPGLDVIQKNGKITRIYFRNPQNRENLIQEFSNKYGSHLDDPSSRKYLEYRGVYYYDYFAIP